MTRERVENCAVLDVLELARVGHLVEGSRAGITWSRGGKDIAALFWHVEDDCLCVDYLFTDRLCDQRPWQVALTRTRTSVGTERVWFLCPRCGRRVRKLYLPPGRSTFGCRSCHDLSSASRQTRTSVGEGEMDTSETRDESGWLADRGSAEHRGQERVSAPRRDLGPDPLPQVLPPGPTEEAAPGPRPRGRPKKKRSYHRRVPFLSGERPSERHGLCLRCRDYRELRDPQTVTLTNGRSARTGTCPTCGATMVLIVKG
ncbi:MAG: DUF5679 domain-containing protein [Thermoleophilia bacterium]